MISYIDRVRVSVCDPEEEPSMPRHNNTKLFVGASDTALTLLWNQPKAWRHQRTMFQRPLLGLAKAFLAFLLCLLAVQASTQERDNRGSDPSLGGKNAPSATTLPDAPSAHQQPASSSSARQPSSSDPEEGKQPKRILGIIPNFRAVSVDTHLLPQTPKQKFVGFAKDSFDYSSFIWIAALAGISQAKNSTPEFHQGAAGFGRYYWHSFADQTDENLWVEFLLPVAAHQDPRYYTLGRRTANGHNGPLKRAGYAVSRLFITRTDSGGNAFNVSEVGGAGAAAAISNLYYPGRERTWTKTYQRWFLNASLDGITDVFREFWPDINQAIFHGK